MNNFFNYLKAHKLLVLIILFFIAIPFFVFLFSGNKKTIRISPTPSVYPGFTNSPSFPIEENQRFTVIKTTPLNGEANVYPGEITLGVTTNVAITSQKYISFEVTPSLANSLKITSSFPTKNITAQVYGGLRPKTQYTVNVKDGKGIIVYTWSFSTSDETPESSTGLAVEEQQQLIKKYYPLFSFVPYYTSDYSIGYKDQLTLLVRIKNKNANVEQIKKEVNQWIKSHEVDPTTHTVVFENAF